MRLAPAAPRSRVKHSTTEPLHSLPDIVSIHHFEQRYSENQSSGNIKDPEATPRRPSLAGYGKFSGGFIFAKLRIYFVKIKSSRNGEIVLSFHDEGKSCHSHEFLRRKYVF